MITRGNALQKIPAVQSNTVFVVVTERNVTIF